MEKIDFVITWVDGEDKKWLEKRKQVFNYDESLNSESRFRDMHTLKYWFRSVEKYTPWVNKVFFVTDHQIPAWLNLKNNKLRVVNHEDIIDSGSLPTFNSNAIELSFPKIPQLSENFVLFNDDTFINKSLSPDFFFENGLPRDFKSYSMIIPASPTSGFAFNDVEIINKYFTKKNNWSNLIRALFQGNFSMILHSFFSLPYQKIPGYFDSHMPIAYQKNNFFKAEKMAGKLWNETINSQIRVSSNINHLLVRYFQLESDKYIYRNPNLNKYYSVTESEKISEDIMHSKHSLICINDDDHISNLEFLNRVEKINNCFKDKLSEKSNFEVQP